MPKEHVSDDESNQRVESAVNDLMTVAHRRIIEKRWGRVTLELRFEEGWVKGVRLTEETTIGAQ